MHGARRDDRPLIWYDTRRHALERAERDHGLQSAAPFGTRWTASDVGVDDDSGIAADALVECVAQLCVRHVPVSDGTSAS
jgi:hypothetical protein